MTTENERLPGSTAFDAEQRAKSDVASATDRIQGDLNAVGERAAKDIDALKQEAGAQLGQATDTAKSFASDQKDFAATQINTIASAVSKVASELEAEQSTTARYARDFASSLERFGRQVEGKSVDDLMGEAQRFGRSQPLAFLGAAALAGFMASRFAGASAQRRQAETQSTTTSAGATGRTETSGSTVGSSYAQSNGNYVGGGNVTG